MRCLIKHSVSAFMERIQLQIKKLIRDGELVHYVTDSPTSQYRNRTIFYVISHHFTGIGQISMSSLIILTSLGHMPPGYSSRLGMGSQPVTESAVHRKKGI